VVAVKRQLDQDASENMAAFQNKPGLFDEEEDHEELFLAS